MKRCREERSSDELERVHEAASAVIKYTRRDLCHERFDCDWSRDWKCMFRLLNVLRRSSAADKLLAFCTSKLHTSAGGETISDYNTHTFHHRRTKNITLTLSFVSDALIVCFKSQCRSRNRRGEAKGSPGRLG